MRVVAGIAVVVIAVVLLIVLEDNGDEGGGNGASNAPAGEAAGDGTTSAGGKGEAGARNGNGSAQVAVPTVVVDKSGKPVGGVRNLTYKEGDQVRFRAESDVNDEVHLHGYDISKDVEAGGSVDFDFTADIEGVFEVELEGREEQIVQLTVAP
jgi:hypothetical protein